jgi:4-methyl-5(b-hydroxyethyl)-thiazole monophosphate biosynthesis
MTETMKTAYIFFADGFEEIEALSSVDVLRRAGMNVVTVSVHDDTLVTGAHGVPVEADALFDELDYADAQWLILPGGMPGATNLRNCEPLCDLLLEHYRKGGYIAAICASPAIVFGPLGLLKDHEAVCYPGMGATLNCRAASDEMVVVSGNVVTGKGPAAASQFALAIVAMTEGVDKAQEVAAGMLL